MTVVENSIAFGHFNCATNSVLARNCDRLETFYIRTDYVGGKSTAGEPIANYLKNYVETMKTV